jgi:anti-sigma regulatory factor (Ser/Thr protein kinase)
MFRGQLPPTVDATTAARAAVREWLAQNAEQFDHLDDLDLVVTELVANAVLHAYPPIELEARLDEGTVRVDVHDAGVKRPRINSHPDGDGGYGLRIVDAVARWGWTQRPDGKVVWAEIPRP